MVKPLGRPRTKRRKREGREEPKPVVIRLSDIPETPELRQARKDCEVDIHYLLLLQAWSIRRVLLGPSPRDPKPQPPRRKPPSVDALTPLVPR